MISAPSNGVGIASAIMRVMPPPAERPTMYIRSRRARFAEAASLPPFASVANCIVNA